MTDSVVAGFYSYFSGDGRVGPRFTHVAGLCRCDYMDSHRGSLLGPKPHDQSEIFHRTPMIRFILRFFGLWILAAAFVFLVYDGTKSIAAGIVLTKPFGETWNDINSNSLLLLQPAIERHVAVWLWDPVILSILTAPTWLVLGVIGIVLILLGRKKKPLIGYTR
ncbi:MAG: hypothetical protein R3D52_13450 [Xanthobacteraceae bacterium]